MNCLAFIKQIKLILSTYPRRHLYLLLLGNIFLNSLVFFSSLNLDSNPQREALISKIPIEKLDFDLDVEAGVNNSIQLKSAEIKGLN